jgi:eukaryotic-like serine/threonine-protein kinase
MEVRVAAREGTILGPYHLVRLLGAGGTGEVYLAQGPAASGESGQIAVKLLRGSAVDAAAQAIAQQAQAISALHLPHVLPVHAVAAEADTIYIAMAYAPAGSLAAAFGIVGGESLHLPLGAGTVARLVTQVARALQPLHQHGTVHGDLKLTNLFVRTSPQGGPLVAVSDFGQPIVLDLAVAALNRNTPDPTGSLADALRCAAPEQLTGHHLPASDQYALATIAYLLLTGQYPFEGDAQSLAAAVARGPVTPPTHLDPTIPLPAEEALLRALAKDPNARYPDVATFAQALGDGLASAVHSGNATLQFGYLAGASPAAASGVRPSGALAMRGTYGPGASHAGPGGSAVRRIGTSAPAASGVRPRPVAPPAAAPSLTALGLLPRTPRQRALAIIAATAILVLGLAGFLGLRALEGSATTTRAPLPNFGGLDYAPTVTPDATAIARTQIQSAAGLAELKRASATTPVFSDALTSNAHHWAVDGKRFFFGSDGRLHGTNNTLQSVATLAQPVSAPANYLVTVNMTFLKASPSDVAGLSVRAQSSSAAASRYLMLIAPEGRYEVWYYDGARWSDLSNGYASAIKTGLNTSNTLSVLCDGQQIWFFVNGEYVTDVADFSTPDSASTLGPVVVYATTEVAFDHYDVYHLGS